MKVVSLFSGIGAYEKALRNIEKANIIIASGVFAKNIRENIEHFAKENNKKIEIFSI